MPAPDEERQEQREDAERRARGVSPVVEGRGRSKLGMVAGALVILLVVGFLFVSGGEEQ